MKLVKEYINEKFTQDSDPIQDMGIGMINCPIDFKSKDELTKWVLKHIKSILGVKKIPEDIILSDKFYLKLRYTQLIQNYAIKYFTIRGSTIFPSDVFPDWEKMKDIFHKRGYKYWHNDKTNLDEKFTQDTDPIKDMGIGYEQDIRNGLEELKNNFGFYYLMVVHVPEKIEGYLEIHHEPDISRSRIQHIVGNFLGKYLYHNAITTKAVSWFKIKQKYIDTFEKLIKF